MPLNYFYIISNFTLFGLRNTMGLHQAVANCIERCHAAKMRTDHTWFKTVVLAGGTACLPGLQGIN